MATYTIKLDEQTNTGKALKEYLQSLGILVKRISSSTNDNQEADDVTSSSEHITKEELVTIPKEELRRLKMSTIYGKVFFRTYRDCKRRYTAPFQIL